MDRVFRGVKWRARGEAEERSDRHVATLNGLWGQKNQCPPPPQTGDARAAAVGLAPIVGPGTGGLGSGQVSEPKGGEGYRQWRGGDRIRGREEPHRYPGLAAVEMSGASGEGGRATPRLRHQRRGGGPAGNRGRRQKKYANGDLKKCNAKKMGKLQKKVPKCICILPPPPAEGRGSEK